MDTILIFMVIVAIVLAFLPRRPHRRDIAQSEVRFRRHRKNEISTGVHSGYRG